MPGPEKTNRFRVRENSNFSPLESKLAYLDSNIDRKQITKKSWATNIRWNNDQPDPKVTAYKPGPVKNQVAASSAN